MNTEKIGIENIRQRLIESMADFLESEGVAFEQAVNLPGLEDDEKKHIRMAEAALSAFLSPQA